MGFCIYSVVICDTSHILGPKQPSQCYCSTDPKLVHINSEGCARKSIRGLVYVREDVKLAGVREEDAEGGEKEEADTLQQPLNGKTESGARKRHPQEFPHLQSYN